MKISRLNQIVKIEFDNEIATNGGIHIIFDVTPRVYEADDTAILVEDNTAEEVMRLSIRKYEKILAIVKQMEKIENLTKEDFYEVSAISYGSMSCACCLKYNRKDHPHPGETVCGECPVNKYMFLNYGKWGCSNYEYKELFGTFVNSIDSLKLYRIRVEEELNFLRKVLAWYCEREKQKQQD